MKTHIGALLVLLSLVIIWELLVQFFVVPVYVLPAPSRIARCFVSDFSSLFNHSFVTLGEVALGFVLALAGASALALVIFYDKTVERALYPLVIFLQNMPLFAIAPLLKLWMGFTIWPKVTIAALIAFFPIVVNTVDGLRSTDPDFVDFFKVLGASKRQILQNVQILSALPFIFSGARVGVTLSVVGAVIGEWVGAQAGLGYLMLRANATLRTDLVFAAILWLSVLGFLLFGLLTLLERWMMPWGRFEH